MTICIICRLEKADFNKEHVIPFAVGGQIVINTVCTSCNSRMGTNVDSHLTNMFLVQMKRRELGITGRDGFLPDPWIGPALSKDRDGEKVLIKRDNEGKIYFSKPLKFEKSGTDYINIKMTGPLDAVNKKLDRVLKQYNLTREAITNFQLNPVEINIGTAVKNFLVDVPRFYLAFLKIAYEITVSLLPAYFGDERAIEISRRLANPETVNEFENPFLIDPSFLPGYDETLAPVFDFESDNHYLILMQLKAGLLCHVKIFSLSFFFLVSQKQYLQLAETVAVKNDIGSKQALLYRFTDILWHMQNGQKI